MKTKIIITLLLNLIICFSAHSRNLTETEAKTVKSDVKLLLNHFVESNAEAMAEMNHESVFQLTGGKDGFINMIKATMKVTEELDVKISELIFFPPSRVFEGTEEVCFIPLSYVLDYGSYKAKTKGFFIAVLNPKEKTWKYIEGRGLKNNKQLLWVLLPSLPKDIDIPEIKDEYL